jgi:hypothetical protein
MTSVGSDDEGETKAHEHAVPPALAQAAVIDHAESVGVSVGMQNVHAARHRQPADSGPRLPRLSQPTEQPALQLVLEQLQELRQQMQSIMQRQQHSETAAEEQQRAAASARRQTQALPSYPATPAVGEYSAGAVLPLPPRVPVASRRASHGIPSTPAAYLPFTPAAQRAAAEAKDSSDDEQGDAVLGVQAREASMPVREKRMEQVKKSMLTSVKPFFGRTQQDTYTVIDWVEKVDTEFSINMGEREEGRMDVVRSLLAGQALKWANRRVAELNALGEDAEWRSIRASFINAHLGSSTIETFKAELRALRLGRGAGVCKNPSELNTQFDQLAELAYPMALGLTDRRADAAMATVLGDEYRRIVADSVPAIWRNIERSAAPTTLDEWKVALARHWNAERTIQNMSQQLQPANDQPAYRGAGTSRGGRGRGGGSSGSTQHVLNAILDTNEREEGETDPQLSAAFTTLGRGGRGGGSVRGGRGRGAGTTFTPEQQLLYDEGKCFTCQEKGHQARACPNKPSQPASPSAGQLNSQAGR